MAYFSPFNDTELNPDCDLGGLAVNRKDSDSNVDSVDLIAAPTVQSSDMSVRVKLKPSC